MRLDWKSLLSLKTSVIIAFVVIWNAGFLLAMYLGGGGLNGALTDTGMRVSGYVCLAACLFSLSVALSKPLQSILIEPNRAENFNTKEFYFLAFISGALAISRFTFPAMPVG